MRFSYHKKVIKKQPPVLGRRPPNRIDLLDRYIRDTDIAYVSDILDIGYHNASWALRGCMKRHPDIERFEPIGCTRYEIVRKRKPTS